MWISRQTSLSEVAILLHESGSFTHSQWYQGRLHKVSKPIAKSPFPRDILDRHPCQKIARFSIGGWSGRADWPNGNRLRLRHALRVGFELGPDSVQRPFQVHFVHLRVLDQAQVAPEFASDFLSDVIGLYLLFGARNANPNTAAKKDDCERMKTVSIDTEYITFWGVCKTKNQSQYFRIFYNFNVWLKCL